MDVASLVKECNKLGPPVDLVEVSEECFGWSPAQVLQLRLEHLLLQRRLEVTEGRLKKTEIQLKEMEGKVVRRNEEIKNLKDQIRILIGRNSEGPADQTAEEDDEEYETFDWSTAGQMSPGNEEDSDETPSSNEGTLGEESVIAHDEESEVEKGNGEVMEEMVESKREEEEEDLEGACTNLIIVNVTSIAKGMNHTLEPEVGSDNVDLEMGDESCFSSSNCILPSENQGSSMNECEGMVGPPPQPKAPATGIPPRKRHGTRQKAPTLWYTRDQSSSSRTHLRISAAKEAIAGSSTSNVIPISEPQRSPMDKGGSMDPGISQEETSTPTPVIIPRQRLRNHSEQDRSLDRPSSTLANHSDSDMEVSSGKDERTAPNSVDPTVAVANTKKRFACPDCPQTFIRKDNLLRHGVHQHGIETGPFKCDQCENAFLSKEDLKRHNHRCHRPESEKTFNCKYCSKVFFSKSHRGKHQSLHDRTTGQVKILKCELCPHKSFGTNDTLKRHDERFHPQLN